jgi:hypothetical protein
MIGWALTLRLLENSATKSMLMIKSNNFRCEKEWNFDDKKLSEIHFVANMSVFAIRNLGQESAFPLKTENSDIVALPVEDKTGSDELMLGSEQSVRNDE